MTSARGLLVAGAVAIAVTSAHAAYRAWPVTHGVEIAVPAELFRQPVQVGVVLVRLPVARIELDVPRTAPAPAPAMVETFVPLRQRGHWWIEGGDAHANMRALRGRQLFVQFDAGQPIVPGGPVEARPVTVSDVVVDGAINLGGRVERVGEDGHLWLGFSIGWIGVPSEVESGARPLVGGAPGRGDSGASAPVADPAVFAVLRVLPSGRAALTGVIVKGKRY